MEMMHALASDQRDHWVSLKNKILVHLVEYLKCAYTNVSCIIMHACSHISVYVYVLAILYESYSNM